MSSPYDGLSTDPNVAGVLGENTAGGPGVSGRGTPAGDFQSASSDGVYAISYAPQHYGVSAANDAGGGGVFGRGTPGGGFESPSGDGVDAVSHSPQHSGVVGVNDAGNAGVSGRGTPAGDFQSSSGDGVYAISYSPQHCGVAAGNDSGGIGVFGRGTPGGAFESASGNGVYALSHDAQHAGVFGANDNGGIGVYGKATQAGIFEGNVTVTGTIGVTGDVILTGADCAEEFGVAAAAEVGPGTVMVLDEQGMLQPSQQAYDKKVAGVISGAGDYRPGLILDKKESSGGRMPVALVGKVYCKVDAHYAPVAVGDLLTTSPTPGHAMKADEPLKAFGSVIGKALRGLESGQGLVPILVALQ